MEQWKKDRISELTRISRERELTEAEQEERKLLRAEYLQSWKESVVGTLDRTHLSFPQKANKRRKIPRESSVFFRHLIIPFPAVPAAAALPQKRRTAAPAPEDWTCWGRRTRFPIWKPPDG